MDAALRQFLAGLDYSFADEALLHRALRHASLDVEDDNEHLEFLGDRVLGLVIAEELLARYPQEKEGDLARRQAELVSRRICAEIAAEVNLDAVIRCDPGQRGGGGAPARNILANGCEAVLGAVYLDGGLQAAAKVILALWRARLDAQTAAPIDAKTELQEWAMKRKHWEVFDMGKVRLGRGFKVPASKSCINSESISWVRAGPASRKSKSV